MAGAAGTAATPLDIDAAPGTMASESTRDRLLDAAIAVFSEKGYDGTGVQEIARRAGLTTGAIYANFRGKADLLFSAIDARSGPEFDELLRSSRTPSTAGELLTELGSHLLERDADAEAEGGLLIEAIVAARRDSQVATLVRTLIDQRMTDLGGLVELARAEGVVDSDISPEALTRFCLVLALGSLLYGSIGLDEPDPAQWATLIRRLVGSLHATDQGDHR